MNAIRRLYVRIRESPSGQTMTEYAMIVTAIAVVVYVGYQALGTSLNSDIASLDNQL
jgi:Flp pilus assembly pilin Flp